MKTYFAKSTGGFYFDALHGVKIPVDAVEITYDEHAALLAGQSIGKVISADADGMPCLIDQPAPTSEQLSNSVRAQRDALLAACDWTQCRDVPDVVAAAWQPYRQALRDLTKQAGFPESIDWPVQP